MSLKKRTLRAYKSRIRSSGQSRKVSKHSAMNAWLMTFATIGLLSVAVAQLYLVREQAKSAASITRLELAKARPRLRIIPSQSFVNYGGTEPGTYVELPNYFDITMVSGVDTIFTIDSAINVHISDDDGATFCSIEFRGMFLQDGQRERLDLFPQPVEDFEKLINALGEQGIEFSYPRWHFLVQYFDLYGDLKVDYLDLRLRQEPPVQDALILYSGVWSDGTGFYYDEDPSKWCPNISNKLEGVIQELGGAPGNIYQRPENSEWP
jgi:hypothetical protein